MTSEELFNEASRLFPRAGHIYATICTQTERNGSQPFTIYTIGAGTGTADDTKFDIAYGYGYTPEECIVKVLADAETKRKKAE